MSEGPSIPLRDYIDRGMADLTAYHNKDTGQIHAELDRRIVTVMRELDMRFAQVTDRISHLNELREAMRDQAASFVTAEVINTKFNEIEHRTERLEGAFERQRGRAAAYAAIAGLVGIVATVLTLFINHVRF